MTNVDVLMITAVPDEANVIKKVEPGWARQEDSRGFTYYTRDETDINGNPFTVALSRPVDMGGNLAANVATRLVSELNPRCLCMAGICAGWKNKVFLGDVVVAERIFQYDGGKLVAFGKGNERAEDVFQDIRTYNLHPVWIQKSQDFGDEWVSTIQTPRPLSFDSQKLWLLNAISDYENGGGPLPGEKPGRKERCPDFTQVIDKLEEDRLVFIDDDISLSDKGKKYLNRFKLRNPDGPPPEPGQPSVHVAPMGSGSQVKEDPDIFPAIAKYMRKVRAIEMEAAAIAAVAEMEGLDRCIIAKAVSDYADTDKNDHFRTYAIEASYRFLINFLKHYLPESEKAPLSSPQPVGGDTINIKAGGDVVFSKGSGKSTIIKGSTVGIVGDNARIKGGLNFK